MKRKAALLTLFVASAGLSPVAAPAAAAPHCAHADDVPTARTLSRARTATVCLLNRERHQHKLHTLSVRTQLSRASAAFARQMVRERFFDHVDPAGTPYERRLRPFGYATGATRWWLGENIGWATAELATPAQVVRAWMHSPGHRRNILTRRYRDVGVGIVARAPEAIAPGVAAATYVTEFGKRTARR